MLIDRPVSLTKPRTPELILPLAMRSSHTFYETVKRNFDPVGVATSARRNINTTQYYRLAALPIALASVAKLRSTSYLLLKLVGN